MAREKPEAARAALKRGALRGAPKPSHATPRASPDRAESLLVVADGCIEDKEQERLREEAGHSRRTERTAVEVAHAALSWLLES